MTDKTSSAFDAIANEYDEWVKQALSNYEEMFTVATELIPFERNTPLQIADLGAGSGLFAERIIAEYPNAIIELVDESHEMLQVAKHRFRNIPERILISETNLNAFQPPAQHYDLIVSSLAIHHLEHSEKQILFKKVFTGLKSGGLFINVDQVRGDDTFGALYWDTWLEKVRRTAANEKKIQSSISRRQTYDKDASLVEQLNWLEDAGLRSDCIYKHYFVAVFLGLKNH